MRKPHKSTVEWVLNDANILAEETLFIDDSVENIEAARELGFQTIHLTDPSLIKSEISKFLFV